MESEKALNPLLFTDPGFLVCFPGAGLEIVSPREGLSPGTSDNSFDLIGHCEVVIDVGQPEGCISGQEEA